MDFSTLERLFLKHRARDQTSTLWYFQRVCSPSSWRRDLRFRSDIVHAAVICDRLPDLPLNYHLAAIRASALFDMPNGAVIAIDDNS
jgi:hypothetical protein